MERKIKEKSKLKSSNKSLYSINGIINNKYIKILFKNKIL